MTGKNKSRLGGEQVSDLTAGRLSVYLRCLTVLEAEGTRAVSSRTLAERFYLNAPQIRKDLAYFGEFGVRGVGYHVRELREHLRQILGLARTVRVAIFGAGNLGLALADYGGFRREGFVIEALFDNAVAKIGRRSRAGIPIHDIAEFRKLARKTAIDIGVLAVPAESAQAVATIAIGGGIRAILNFSPGTITVPAGVKLKNVDLTVSMESLSFFLTRGGADGPS